MGFQGLEETKFGGGEVVKIIEQEGVVLGETRRALGLAVERGFPIKTGDIVTFLGEEFFLIGGVSAADEDVFEGSIGTTEEPGGVGLRIDGGLFKLSNDLEEVVEQAGGIVGHLEHVEFTSGL